MNIELKNIKHHPRLSDETECFSATIYIDGVKAGEVTNRGEGGPNAYSFNDVESRLNAYAKTLPKTKWEGGEYEQDADCVIGDLLDKFLALQEKKRWCRNAVVFKLKDDAEGQFRTIKATLDQRVRDFLAKKYGDRLDYILNDRLTA
jgi:hypothetical protein